MKNSFAELSSEEQRLLGELLDQEGLQLLKPRTISRRKIKNPPLSYAQQRMWFLHQLEVDGGGLYNIPTVLRIRGCLQVVALEQAINEIVQRHEALRTGFAQVSGSLVQLVHPMRHTDLPIIDLCRHAEERREEEVRRLVQEWANTSLDITGISLLRTILIRVGAEEHILGVIMHHIASDAWSLGVFSQELAVLYEAFSARKASPLPELPFQYADYAVWQREWLQGSVMEGQLGYWKKQLAELPDLELPMARARPAVRSNRGAVQTFEISEELLKSLEKLGESEGATLFMTLLAAFQVLLHRYSGQRDIVVGSPIAGRTQRETEGLIGFFVNTLILRTDLSGGPGFRSLLKRVRDMALEAYANQDVPFEKLVEALDPDRDLNRAPLFQVMFILQNAPEAEWILSELDVEKQEIEFGQEEFDLRLELKTCGRGLWAQIGYRTDLLDGVFVRKMAGHFQVLLGDIVANPETQIGQLKLLTRDETWQVLEDWNRTGTTYPGQRCMHELFEGQTKCMPDAVAIEHEGSRLTYAELNRRANQLAHYLRAKGVGAEVRVGICVGRCLDMVVGLLGILKAGGVYVPLDPEYPPDRLKFMLEDSNIGVLVTQSGLQQHLPASGAKHVCLDTEWNEIGRYSAESPRATVEPTNAAYIIYTSGSTGKPKGTIIEHHSVVTLLFWSHETYGDEELAGVLASTSICFDLSVFELFVPLSWGGTVIIAQNALQLPILPQAHKVKLINTVPSAITELLRMKALPPGICTVNLAGEPLKRKLVEDIYQGTSVRKIFNLYGPTEDTTYSTCALVKRGDEREVPIGRPLSNTQTYVLNADFQPMPVGIPGELYISGGGLARGYLERPDFTAQRFTPNPFSQQPGGRMYRTGDLARWVEDGNLEFLGRMDHQVKIRGFRVELGEIETALERLPEVDQAVAGVWEADGDTRLIAHYVGSGDSERIRSYLKRELPEYMMPSWLIKMGALPLTPNGKVDRKRLPGPDTESLEPKNTYAEPRNPLEELLANIWADVLKVNRVGIDDNFFRLGGHSLLATRMMSRIREVFYVDVPLRDLFEAPSVAEFARAVTARESKAGQIEKIARIFKQVQEISSK